MSVKKYSQHFTKIPSASLSYPDDYKVILSNDQLNALATTSYTTHKNPTSEWLHKASQFCLLPWRKSLQFFAYSLQSRPGENKEDRSIFRSKPASIARGFLGILFLTVSAVFGAITLPIHLAALFSYKSRPILSYINNSSQNNESKSKMSQESPLHIRTHNIGLVIESMGIVTDLRPVKQRVNEIADNILKDKHQPDVICFQEVFHEDGARELCNRIKTQYPYIITNVLPTASGFNSGAMIASKYPLRDVHFHCLANNIGIERLAPKGVLRVIIDTDKGPVAIYNAHTQALLGKERANARYLQIEQIKTIMATDKLNTPMEQILVGDLNTSSINAWGENNIIDTNNPEAPVQKKLHEEFEDIFLKDHDQLTGNRCSGQPRFLSSDNKRMEVEHLPEPSGSWYVGPVAKPDTFLATQALKRNEEDKKVHQYTAPPVPGKNSIKTDSLWGTGTWRQTQPADTARFDYVLFPLYKGERSKLNGLAEIRRIHAPKEAQSAASDHLPIDALVYSR